MGAGPHTHTGVSVFVVPAACEPQNSRLFVGCEPLANTQCARMSDSESSYDSPCQAQLYNPYHPDYVQPKAPKTWIEFGGEVIPGTAYNRQMKFLHCFTSKKIHSNSDRAMKMVFLAIGTERFAPEWDCVNVTSIDQALKLRRETTFWDEPLTPQEEPQEETPQVEPKKVILPTPPHLCFPALLFAGNCKLGEVETQGRCLAGSSAVGQPANSTELGWVGCAARVSTNSTCCLLALPFALFQLAKKHVLTSKKHVLTEAKEEASM